MKFSRSQRGFWFLTASFISAFGDIVLVTSLPQGLGFETGKISFSVVAWLVPALSVFAASFFARTIAKRHDSARLDYAKVLFAVAALEIVVSILTLFYKDPVSSLVLTILFLLGYAFVKEGIPRLLYQVTMYRFFADESEYKKLVNFKGAIDVAAMLIGMLVAAALVSAGNWRFGLLIDALSFIVFGVVLVYVGQNYYADAALLTPDSIVKIKNKEGIDSTSLMWILMTIPFLHALNALFPNYFPMISAKMGFFDIGTSIVVIALLRLPGLIMGLFYNRLQNFISARFWIRVLPLTYTASGFLFLLMPSSGAMGVMVFMSGLNAGVYYPADILVRSAMSGNDLVHFNTLVLRWLAIFQFTSCCIAIWIYSSGEFNRSLVAVLLVLFAILAFFISRFHSRNFNTGAYN